MKSIPFKFQNKTIDGYKGEDSIAEALITCTFDNYLEKIFNEKYSLENKKSVLSQKLNPIFTVMAISASDRETILKRSIELMKMNTTGLNTQENFKVEFSKKFINSLLKKAKDKNNYNNKDFSFKFFIFNFLCKYFDYFKKELIKLHIDDIISPAIQNNNIAYTFYINKKSLISELVVLIDDKTNKK